MKASPYFDTWKDETLECYIEVPSGPTGDYIPATGLTGVELRLAETEKGTAWTVGSAAASERSDRPGYYFRNVALADITNVLTASVAPHRSKLYVQVFLPNGIQVEGTAKIVRRTEDL